MAKKSAGILLYRYTNKVLELMLVHPGGPLQAKKDLGNWSIPKGEFTDDEAPLDCAKREFKEETGIDLPEGSFIPLSPIKQKGGKEVYAWAMEADVDISNITSNTFPLQWPPKSGKWIDVPEIDKAGWFDVATAQQKINERQVALIEDLTALLNASQSA